MMSDSLLNLGAAHSACLNEALKHGPLMIKKWCNGVVKSLNLRYCTTLQNIEKKHLQASVLALEKYEVAIAQSFVAFLADAIVNSSRKTANIETEMPLDSAASMSFDDLELMGDSQVQDSINMARVMQAIAVGSEAGLAAFSARLSTAQGFVQVKADQNPLRPESFSQALLSAVQGMPVDNAIRTLWFAHGGDLMAQQLQDLYLALNELLSKRGIEPAAYRMKTKLEHRALRQASHFGSNGACEPDAFGSSAFASVGDDLSELPTIEFSQQDITTNDVATGKPSQERSNIQEFRSQLVGKEEASLPKQKLPFESDFVSDQDALKMKVVASPIFDETTQPFMELHRFQTESKSEVPSLVAQLRERIKLEAKSLDQLRATSAVSLMIEKIASDSRLLFPVRQIVANLESAFLRLAILEPHFLSDRSHPARNLLEAIFSRSLAFASTDSEGFSEFMQDIQEVVRLLEVVGTFGRQRFTAVLATFEEKRAVRYASEYENRNGSAQAFVDAEKFDILTKKISEEIIARSDFIFASPIVGAFLKGPWAQVLAKEKLAIDSDKTGMRKAIFRLTMGELLWSLDAIQTSSYPNRLAKLIPSILERLHGGLLSIGSSPADFSAFFDELSTIRQIKLNSRGQRGKIEPVLGGSFGANHPEYGTKINSAKPVASSSTSTESLAPGKLQRFQSTLPFLDTSLEQKPALDPHVISCGDVNLRLGAWVELRDDDQWLRAQLTWISNYKTLLIFTSAAGRSHSMTEPLLQYFLLQGLVKVISWDGA